MQWFTEMALIASVVVGLLASGVSPVCAADLTQRLLAPEKMVGSPVTSRRFPVRAMAQNPAAPRTAAPRAEAPPEADRYKAEGRRDPFESLVKEKSDDTVVRDLSRPRGPLERFDLAALHLTGIVWGELGRRAVIRAPDGKGYFVTVGMYMGQNEGKVIEIENHRVVILEKYQDAKGRRIDKTLTIPLRREE
jgi:Tfp pilus assembly protein PilP